MAPFFSQGGYSSEAHCFFTGLSNTSVATRLGISHHGDSVDYHFMYGLPPQHLQALMAASHYQSAPSRTISACHSEPGAWNVLGGSRYNAGADCPLLGGAYSIGRTMFETDRIPAGWPARLNAMDEVWVPTSFTAEIFIRDGVDRDKVLVVPEAVDASEFDPNSPHVRDANTGQLLPTPYVPERNCEGVSKGYHADCPFRFFSVGKFERRKGFDVLLRAYLTRFEAKQHVELYILTSAYHSSSDFDKAIDEMIEKEIACGSEANANAPEKTRVLCVPDAKLHKRNRPKIRLLTSIPQLDLPLVYAHMDAFLLASRGEGWGRPHVEAMAMRLPVIATLWSGPSEFMTEENSFPVQHSELVEIPSGPFMKHKWAEPDPQSVADNMAFVMENGDEAAKRAAQARDDVVRLYSPAALGRFLEAHFVRIEKVVELRRSSSAAEYAQRIAAAEAAIQESERRFAADRARLEEDGAAVDRNVARLEDAIAHMAPPAVEEGEEVAPSAGPGKVSGKKALEELERQLLDELAKKDAAAASASSSAAASASASPSAAASAAATAAETADPAQEERAASTPAPTATSPPSGKTAKKASSRKETSSSNKRRNNNPPPSAPEPVPEAKEEL